MPDIIYAISNRLDKNMSLVYGNTRGALENRKRFLSGLGIDYRNLVCTKQTHSDHIKYVTRDDSGKGALVNDSAVDDTDALITDQRNLPLAIFTADCLSVFLYDPKAPAIGVVHAGWKSAKENICGKAVKLMQEKFNTDIQGLKIIFGPAIGECCCEVGDDFKGFFGQDIIEREGHLYLDLAGVNKRQVLELGARQANISGRRDCTYCQNDKFFSFRKEGDSSGRMMSVIMLK